MSDWYILIDAAQILRVSPFELLDQPAEWIDWAFAYRSVQAQSQPRQQAPADQGPKPFRGLGA